ncbi:MAG: hypothetical protein ACXAC6_01985 [Candidatus Hodarchaeales archaeon]|jgi:hypothetical protein
MSEHDYTAWIGQEIKKMIDLLTSRSYKSNPDAINTQIGEIQRGIEYGMNNPQAIDPLVMKMARSFVDSIQIYLRQVRRPHTGIPPGGQATVLTGSAVEEPVESDQFSVDELKGALETRKKKKVESKMKGSMDLLKDYD